MRHRVVVAMGVLFGVLLLSAAASGQSGSAQAAKEKETKAKEQRIEGNVRMMDKATNTVTVRLRGKVLERAVVYNDSTKFTFRNKPAKLEDLKEGVRVIVLGTPNDKDQLVASRIDIREETTR